MYQLRYISHRDQFKKLVCGLQRGNLVTCEIKKRGVRLSLFRFSRYPTAIVIYRRIAWKLCSLTSRLTKRSIGIRFLLFSFFFFLARFIDITVFTCLFVKETWLANYYVRGYLIRCRIGTYRENVLYHLEFSVF